MEDLKDIFQDYNKIIFSNIVNFKNVDIFSLKKKIKKRKKNKRNVFVMLLKKKISREMNNFGRHV